MDDQVGGTVWNILFSHSHGEHVLQYEFCVHDDLCLFSDLFH